MEKSFEELDYCETKLGELILRRRKIPMLADVVAYEIILNDEFLMSSLFHAVEDALAHFGIGAVKAEGKLDVVVGGLGLGYTAASALEHDSVGSLTIVEYLEPVIRWHRDGLVPLGTTLTTDARVRFLNGDFFQLAAGDGFDPGQSQQKVHAILLDIDHTPGHWLNPSHARFYSVAGLTRLRGFLHPGGVFAMWSDAQPDADFMDLLRQVFSDVTAEVVTFPNPIRGGESSGSVYVAVNG